MPLVNLEVGKIKMCLLAVRETTKCSIILFYQSIVVPIWNLNVVRGLNKTFVAAVHGYAFKCVSALFALFLFMTF